MTENEALEEHKKDCRKCRDKSCTYNGVDCLQKKDIEVYEEIIRYRELGTVEEIQKAIENLPLHQVEHKLLQEYQNIGTARECKIAVERMKPKKPIQQATTEKTHYKCPCCNNIMQTIYRDGVAWGHIANYCEWCGQKLDRE